MLSNVVSKTFEILPMQSVVALAVTLVVLLLCQVDWADEPKASKGLYTASSMYNGIAGINSSEPRMVHVNDLVHACLASPSFLLDHIESIQISTHIIMCC